MSYMVSLLEGKHSKLKHETVSRENEFQPWLHYQVAL